MLHIRTVDKRTLGLIKKIQSISEFNNLRLVGGTSLALQLGHRKSVDIDFFGKIEIEPNFIIQKLKNIGELKIISTSKTINIFFLDNIKVDIVNYPYKWLDKIIFTEDISLASIIDISAMKLSAITNRGTKKDFIDLFFLMKEFPLKKLMTLYLEKYPEGNEFLVLKSLGYFEDAEDEPMPYMFEKIEWEDIKEKIRQEIAKY